MRARLVGEWCGTCVEKLDDHLNGVAGRPTDPHSTNNPDGAASRLVNGLVASKKKSGSQERLINERGDKGSPHNNQATGYGIVKYYETTYTSGSEGVGTGSSSVVS